MHALIVSYTPNFGRVTGCTMLSKSRQGIDIIELVILRGKADIDEWITNKCNNVTIMSKMKGKYYNNVEKKVFLPREAREDFPEEVTCN